MSDNERRTVPRPAQYLWRKIDTLRAAVDDLESIETRLACEVETFNVGMVMRDLFAALLEEISGLVKEAINAPVAPNDDYAHGMLAARSEHKELQAEELFFMAKTIGRTAESATIRAHAPHVISQIFAITHELREEGRKKLCGNP